MQEYIDSVSFLSFNLFNNKKNGQDLSVAHLP